MVIIFGQNLIFITGILAGLFFFLSFLGCSCVLRARFQKLIPRFFIFNHGFFVKLSFLFVVTHITLAILANLGVFL